MTQRLSAAPPSLNMRKVSPWECLKHVSDCAFGGNVVEAGDWDEPLIVVCLDFGVLQCPV